MLAWGFSKKLRRKVTVEAEKMKMLVVTNRERAPAIPDVPTASEAGYSSLDFGWLDEAR